MIKFKQKGSKMDFTQIALVIAFNLPGQAINTYEISILGMILIALLLAFLVIMVIRGVTNNSSELKLRLVEYQKVNGKLQLDLNTALNDIHVLSKELSDRDKNINELSLLNGELALKKNDYLKKFLTDVLREKHEVLYRIIAMNSIENDATVDLIKKLINKEINTLLYEEIDSKKLSIDEELDIILDEVFTDEQSPDDKLHNCKSGLSSGF